MSNLTLPTQATMHEPKLVELKLGSGSWASKAPSTVLANFNSSHNPLGVKTEQVEYNYLWCS